VKIAILDIFNCFKCEISFSNQEDKNQHNAIFHRKFQCIYCSECKLFASFNGLDYHIKNQHQAEKIQCKFNYRCTIYFKTEEDKQKHIVKVHQSETKCVYCKKTINNLSRHVRKLHGNEAIKCNFHQACPTYFLSIEEREKHILEDHKTGATRKFCIYCKKMFQCLAKHIRSHHKSEAIKCNYNKKCGFYFRTEQERRKHIEKVHEKNTGKLMKCIYCQRTTSYLSRHVRIHHEQEAIQCNLNCTTYFLSQEDKQKHISQVHKKKNTVKCIYCEKMLRDKQWQHMKICHKDVAIKCNFSIKCPTYFHTEEERDQHVLKIHQTAKPAEEIECLYCGKMFFIRDTYFHHIKFKHSDVKIKCGYSRCGEYFHTHEDREKHFQKVHAEIEILKKYLCNLCSYKSNEKATLKLHVAAKHGTENVKCWLCLKRFKSQLSLKIHLRNMHATRKNTKTCIYCKNQISEFMSRHLLSELCKICNEAIPCREIKLQHKKVCQRN